MTRIGRMHESKRLLGLRHESLDPVEPKAPPPPCIRSIRFIPLGSPFLMLAKVREGYGSPARASQPRCGSILPPSCAGDFAEMVSASMTCGVNSSNRREMRCDGC